MPFNTDIRQAVVLALESQGADVGMAVRDVLRDIGREQAVLTKEWEEGSVSIEQFIGGMKGLNAENRKYREILDETQRAEGEALRARIDGYARAERSAEQLAATNKKAVDEQIADEARLQAALGKMEARKHDDAAEAAYEQQLRDEAALNEALARMEREAGDAAVEAQKRAADAHDRGKQAVADHVQVVQREIAAERDAAAAIDREADELERLNQGIKTHTQNVGQTTAATRDQIQALKDMGVIQNRATATTQTGTTSNKAYGASLMSVAYAMDDIRYGIGAVINNVPMLAMAFGASPQWAAGISIASIAIYELGKAIAPVAKELAEEFGVMSKATEGFGDHIKVVKEQLASLESIKVKTIVDYADIENARKELQRLTAEQAAYERLRTGKTEAQQKRSKTVSDAITEGGGATDLASGVENIIEATRESLPVEDRPQTKNSRIDLAEATRIMNDPASTYYQKQAASERINYANSVIRNNRAQELRDREIKARGIVTGAAEGRQSELGQLSGIFNANPDRFADRGVDMLRFGAGLEMASPSNLFADERQKIAEETDKKDKAKQWQLSKAELDMKVAAEKAADKTESERAAKDERMRAAEVQAEDDNRKADHQKLVEQQKADRAKATADKKAGAANDKEQQAVQREGVQIGKGYVPQVEALLAQAQMNGLPRDRQAQYAANLGAQLAQSLRQQGVPGQDAQQMAWAIVKEGIDEFNQDNQRNFATTGNMFQALQATLAEAINQQQAMGVQLQQQLTKINMMGGNMNRSQVRGKTGQMTFGIQ